MAHQSLGKFQSVWINLQQADRDAPRQQELLAHDFFPLFMELCPSASSVTFKATFGDGSTLLNIICRIFERDTASAVSRGLDGVSQLLSSPSHTVLLSLLTTLVDKDYYGVLGGHLISTLMRILVSHNTTSNIISLHNSFLGMVSQDSELLKGMAPEVVAAEKKHLSLINQLISIQDISILDEFRRCNGFMSVLSTISVCYQYPFWCSASLTTLALDILQLSLGNERILGAVSSPSVIVAAERALLQCMADDAAHEDALAESDEPQKLLSLSHSLSVLWELRSVMETPGSLPFGPAVTAMLRLQKAMLTNRRTTETLFDTFFKFAYVEEAAPSAAAAGQAGSPSGKKKGFFSTALGAAKGLLGGRAKHHDVEKRRVANDVSCLQAAVGFIVSSTESDVRLLMFQRLHRALLSDLMPENVAALADSLSIGLTSFDAPVLGRFLSMLQDISARCDISDTIERLGDALPDLSPEHQRSVLMCLTSLAHSNKSLLGAIASSSIIRNSCVLLERVAFTCFRDGSQDGDAPDEDTVAMLLAPANAIYCLWKVLLQSFDSVQKFERAKALSILLDCCLLDVTGISSGQAFMPLSQAEPSGGGMKASEQGIRSFVQASRSALVSLVYARRQSIEEVVDRLRQERVSTGQAGGNSWNQRLSSLMLTLAVVLFGASCHSEAYSCGAVEECFQLLSIVEGSPDIDLDTYLIASTLLLLLQSESQWSSVCRLLEAVAPPSLGHAPAMQRLVIMIGCGYNMIAENMCLLMELSAGTRATEPPAERFVTALLHPQRLDAGLHCEHAAFVRILCQWHKSTPSPDLATIIKKLVPALNCPITDKIIIETILDNSWNELLCHLANYSSIASFFSLPRTSERESTPHCINSCCQLDNGHAQEVIDRWHGALRECPLRDAITFYGSGGVNGVLIPPSSRSWPPSSGLTISGWFYWTGDEIMASPGTSTTASQTRFQEPSGEHDASTENNDGSEVNNRSDMAVGASEALDIPLWDMRWDYPGQQRAYKIALAIDNSSRKRTVLQIQSGNSSEDHEFPFLPPRQWWNIIVVLSKSSGFCVMFVNGALVKNVPVNYPSLPMTPQGASLIASASAVDICIGFRPTYSVSAEKLALSMGPFTVYEGTLPQESICELASASINTVDAAYHGPVGTTSYSLAAPVLPLAVLMKMSCWNLKSIVTSRSIKFTSPDYDIIFSLHPKNCVPGSSIRDGGAEEPTNWHIVNVAGNDHLMLSGRHSLPPCGLAHRPTHLCCITSTHEWFYWLCSPDLPPSSLAKVFDIIAICILEGSDFEEFCSREHFYVLANIIMASPSRYYDPAVLRALLRLILRPLCRETQSFVTISRTVIRKPSEFLIVFNGPLMEMILFNWRFLANMPLDALTMILEEVLKLLVESNPFASVNAARMRYFSFFEGFLYGLTRHVIPFEALALIHKVVCEFVRASASDSALIVPELMTYLVMLAPPLDEAMMARLGTRLPSCCYGQIYVARNVVLHAVHENWSSLDLASQFPLHLFFLLTDRCSHPVSAALALSLFSRLYCQCTAFRAKVERSGVIRAIARNLNFHAHQPDTLSIITALCMGTARDPTIVGSTTIEETFRAQTFFPQTLPLLLALLKYVSLSIQDSLQRSPPLACFQYFLTLGIPRRPRRHFARVAFAVLAAVLLTHRRHRSNSSEVSPRTAAERSLSPVREQPNANERRRRIGLCQTLLKLLTDAINNNEAVQASLFSPSNSFNNIDMLSWVVLAGMKQSDDYRRAPEKIIEPTAEDKDADLCLDMLDSFMAIDINELSAPLFPDIIDSVYKVYSVLQEKIAVQGTGADLIALLNQVLMSFPIGIGDQAQMWFQIQILHFWLNNLLSLVRRSLKMSSDKANQVIKNAMATVVYCVERLSSGLPAPPRTVASTIAGLIAATTNSNDVKALKALLGEWAVFILSANFHHWSQKRLVLACDLIHEFRPLLLSHAFASSEHARYFIRCLIEISLAAARAESEYIGSDAAGKGTAPVSPGLRRVGEIWRALFAANRSAPLFSLLFVDGGGTTGRPRVDLLHGGFDLLYLPDSDSAISAFVEWLVQYSGPLNEMLARNPNFRSDIRPTVSNPQRQVRSLQRVQDDIIAERASIEQRTDELIGSFLVEKTISGSIIAQDLLFARQVMIRSTVVHDPSPNGVRNLHTSGLCVWEKMTLSLPLRDSLHPLAADWGTLESNARPLHLILPHFGCVASAAGCSSPLIGASCTVIVRPSAQALLDRLVSASTNENRDSAVHWIGNVYTLTGNDSLICVLAITKAEVLVITSAVFSPEGELLVTSLGTHDAASKKASRGMVQQMVRRFLPRVNMPSGLAAASIATFRHSQYYRQLRTEALYQERDCRVISIPLASLVEVHHRYFQHQPAAMELVKEDGSRAMFVFLDRDMVMSREARQAASNVLAELAPHVTQERSETKRARVVSAQRKWLRRQLSTFEYLMVLNDAASRTTADLTQYPVMPWVLSVYDEVHIGLDNPHYYRPLGTPLGALDAQRCEEVCRRYEQWCDDTTPPFHYGTHYSTSAVVMYYLVRLQPMTRYAISYQGGRLDVPERLFHSVAEAWASCSAATGRDVKELIPEFFDLPHFLLNKNAVALGVRADGAALDDVVLPPWACGDAERFIALNREALESDIASLSLHLWLDLIFGVKQTGEGAVAAVNVFHHLSHPEGLESAMTGASSEQDRKAIVASVDNFGLTPRMLFKTPHPKRLGAGCPKPQHAFLAAIASHERRPISAVFAGGENRQPVVAIMDADGTLLASTLRAYNAARFNQRFILSGPRITCTRRDGSAGVLFDLSSLGLGALTSFACSPSGNAGFCGTEGGCVVVFQRHSWSARHKIAFIIRALISPVRRLVLLPQGLLLVLGDNTISCWRVGHTVALSFSRELHLQSAGDTGVLRDATALQRGRYVCVKDDSIFALSRLGTILCGTSNSQSSPFTCCAALNFPGHSRQDVIACGHADGSLSFWILTFNPDDAVAPYALAPHPTSIAVEMSSITSLSPQSNPLPVPAFSVYIGTSTGGVSSVGFNLSLQDEAAWQ